MRLPSEEQLNVAISWLESNEGEEGGERESCLAVAEWLTDQLVRKTVRDAAREAGIPVAKVRQRLAENARKERP